MARPIYLSDIIDLYDHSRDGNYPIWISEQDDEWNKLWSGSIAVDLMGDLQVDSIDVEDDIIKVYLHDNATSEYWEKYDATRNSDRAPDR